MQVKHEVVFDIHKVTNQQEIPTLKISEDFLHFPEFFNRLLLNEITSGCKHVLVVATKDSNIVGFVSAVTSTESIYVHDLFVSDKFYRHGIGTAMVSALSTIAPTASMMLDLSSVNEDAIKFYEAIGFRKAFVAHGAYSYECKADRITMVRSGVVITGPQGQLGSCGPVSSAS